MRAAFLDSIVDRPEHFVRLSLLRFCTETFQQGVGGEGQSRGGRSCKPRRKRPSRERVPANFGPLLPRQWVLPQLVVLGACVGTIDALDLEFPLGRRRQQIAQGTVRVLEFGDFGMRCHRVSDVGLHPPVSAGLAGVGDVLLCSVRTLHQGTKRSGACFSESHDACAHSKRVDP